MNNKINFIEFFANYCMSFKWLAITRDEAIEELKKEVLDLSKKSSKVFSKAGIEVKTKEHCDPDTIQKIAEEVYNYIADVCAETIAIKEKQLNKHLEKYENKMWVEVSEEDLEPGDRVRVIVEGLQSGFGTEYIVKKVKSEDINSMCNQRTTQKIRRIKTPVKRNVLRNFLDHIQS